MPGGGLSLASGSKVQLSPEEEAAYRDTFNMFDSDGGGLIDSSELSTIMSILGYEVSGDDLDALVAEVDQDGDGEVNFEEFAMMMKECWHTHTPHPQHRPQPQPTRSPRSTHPQP